MWILLDWLAPLGASGEIHEGAQVLRNARHVSGSGSAESQCVYVGAGQGGVECAHGGDIIRIPTNDEILVLNKVLQAFDFYNSWSDGLRTRIQEGCPMSCLLDDSDIVFNAPLSILDCGYVLSAVSSRYLDKRPFDDVWQQMTGQGRMSLDFIRGISDAVLPHTNDQEPFLLGNQVMCQNLFVHKRLAGWIGLLCSGHPPTNGRRHLLRTLGGIVEEWMRFNEDDSRLYNEVMLVQGLLDGVPYSRAETEHRFSVIGWEPADSKVVIKTDVRNDIQQPLYSMLASALSGCITLTYGGGIVLLANLRLRPLPVLKAELSSLLSRAGVSAGISCVFTDIYLTSSHYLQADAALRLGGSTPGELMHCLDCALQYASELLSQSPAADMVHPDLLTLRDYDEKHSTEFFETLKYYLICERSLGKTAEAMNLHRNTLYYRLTRIRELISSELEIAEERLSLLLSFLIDRPV